MLISTIWRLRKEGKKIGAEFRSEDEERRREGSLWRRPPQHPPRSPSEDLRPENKSRAAIAALRAATAARVGIQSEISCSFAVFYLFVLLSFVIRFRIV